MRSPIHQLKEFVRTSRDLKNLGNILEGDPSHGKVVRLRLENRSAILGLLAYAGTLLAGSSAGFAATRIHRNMPAAINPTCAVRAEVAVKAETLECLPHEHQSFIKFLTFEEFAEAVNRRLESEIDYGSLTQEGKAYATRLLSFLRNHAWVNGHPEQPRPGNVQKPHDFRLTALERAPNGWFRDHVISMFDGRTKTLYLAPPMQENPSEVDPYDKTSNSYIIQNDMRTADWLIATHDAAHYKGNLTDQPSPFTDPDVCKLIPQNLMNRLRSHSHIITSTFSSADPRSISFGHFVSTLGDFGKSFSTSVLSAHARSGHLNGVSEAAIYIYVRCLLASGEMPGVGELLSEIALHPEIIHDLIEGHN